MQVECHPPSVRSAGCRSTTTFSDELVKNSLADYATGHFEIACYKALRAAAEAEGESGVVRVCDDIMQGREGHGRLAYEHYARP
jgi:ferritin-like metal-binding protein YciE